MPNTLAIMFTITTYGTWLRGDARGWVDDGVVFPPDPIREILDQSLMKHPLFKFTKQQRVDAGQAMIDSLQNRLNLRIFAMCVQSWHSYFVTSPSDRSIPDIVKCAKDAVRWKLRLDRPLWGADYDKRFCFNASSVRNRINYVERHNLEDGLVARPYSGISEVV
jgi:nucleoside-diphosphate-sugar epimerase